jgi:hypothetical protein
VVTKEAIQFFQQSLQQEVVEEVTLVHHNLLVQEFHQVICQVVQVEQVVKDLVLVVLVIHLQQPLLKETTVDLTQDLNLVVVAEVVLVVLVLRVTQLMDLLVVMEFQHKLQDQQ